MAQGGMSVEVYYDQTGRVEACALDGSSHRVKRSKDETVGDRTGPRLGYSNPSYNPCQHPWSTSAFVKGYQTPARHLAERRARSGHKSSKASAPGASASKMSALRRARATTSTTS